MQVNEICVPYAVSVHGMHFNDSAHATSISELFIKAITHNEQRFNRDETVLFARFREAGMDKMKVARAKVSGLLTAYYTTARGYAGDILHAIFSTPRGTRTEFPALKIEACHVLLGLAPNKFSSIQHIQYAGNTLRRRVAASFEYFLLQEQVECKYSPSTLTRNQKHQNSSLLLVSFAAPFCFAEYMCRNDSLHKKMKCCWQAASES